MLLIIMHRKLMNSVRKQVDCASVFTQPLVLCGKLRNNKKKLRLETSFQQVVDVQKHEIYSLDSLGLHCPSSCNTVRYMKLL